MSLITRTDVTAVKLFKEFVLAGIGSYLHVFRKDSAKLLHRIKALNGQKIYGMVPSKCGSKILVFGGKQFTIFSVEVDVDSGDFHCLFEAVICEDWIHSGVWIGDNVVALLTAHNVVQKWSTIPSLLSSHPSSDNSILYSGLLVPLEGSEEDNDVLVLAGTVFSEVIIHCCGGGPLHRLRGHRGVIFSITCAPQKGVIVTTSDDRSVRIWGLNNNANHIINTKLYWECVEISCLNEIYGHSARVMRNCITNDLIVSVGEDSAICYWSLKGELLRKITAHQNASIWSVDADKEHLVTGGGDCAVNLHPLSVVTNYSINEVINLNIDAPKKILFTARRNVIALNDNSDFVYFDLVTKSEMRFKLNHESTYKLIALSSCKQVVAIADMQGKLDVFVENCKDNAYLQNVIDAKLDIGKVLSMQWAGNRHLVLCTENGAITVLASKGNETEKVASFVLPQCKERWLTASAINSTQNVFVVGDRCGNIHVYSKGQINPIKSFSKVHGRYGPTTINIKQNEIKTTGRDGTVKYFFISKDLTEIKYMNSKEFEFQWVEKFIDKNENLVCGFQERVFLVYDLRSNIKLLEVTCGGGHRSWDVVRYIDKINNSYEEVIKFIYVKNSDIHLATFEMSKIVSKNIINGSHAKEINCLKTFKPNLNEADTFYISGGEDTTLRISKLTDFNKFKDEIIFKQLSNIRTVKLHNLDDNKVLIISAGGRAQICIKVVTFERESDEIIAKSEAIVDYLIKGTDKERKGNQNWRKSSIDFDPETRIMDVDLIEINQENFIIFAGCSDAILRIFRLKIANKTEFKLENELNHHETCILKTQYVKFNDTDFLITCSTRGEITFWVINTDNVEDIKMRVIFTTKTNKSGINSIDVKIISDTNILVATGGDDNAIHLVLLKVLTNKNEDSRIELLHSWNSDRFHCSQISGLIFADDKLLSTSIDQRVTLFKWKVEKDCISCEFLSQVFSDIADIQGIEVVDHESMTVCVFGKGLEVIQLGSR